MPQILKIMGRTIEDSFGIQCNIVGSMQTTPFFCLISERLDPTWQGAGEGSSTSTVVKQFSQEATHW